MRQARAVLPLLALALVALACAPVEAAVRACAASLTSGPQVAASEADARRLAMGAWLKAAGEVSPAHANWRLAINKSLACTRVGDRQYSCEAYGAPCVIQHNPGSGGITIAPVPPGQKPPPPRAKRQIDI